MIKKGLPFGTGLLVFVACLFAIWQTPRLMGIPYNWPAAKRYLDTLIDKPWEIVLLSVGLISAPILTIVLPILAARGVRKLVNRRVSAQASARVGQRVYTRRPPRGRPRR